MSTRAYPSPRLDLASFEDLHTLSVQGRCEMFHSRVREQPAVRTAKLARASDFSRQVRTQPRSVSRRSSRVVERFRSSRSPSRFALVRHTSFRVRSTTSIRPDRSSLLRAAAIPLDIARGLPISERYFYWDPDHRG